MTQASTIPERLGALVLDPVSLVAIGLAALALGGIALFARRKTATQAPNDEARLPGPTQPIPLLDTPMEPVLAAPRRTEPSRTDRGVSLLSGLAFAAIGLVAFAGLIGFGLKVAGGSGGQAAPLPPAAPVWTDEATVAGIGPAGCRAGLDAHRASYTHCGASVPVRFEVLDLSVDGERLRDAAWSDASRRAVVLTAPGRPAPFTLAGGADLLAAPGSAMGDYDAFIAVGYADRATDGEGATARAEARGLALADVALRHAQGGRPRDCRSDVTVHAVSLGAAGEGPAPKPLLIGVHVEDRVNRPAGDVGDLDAMLNGLFAGGGAAIIGLDPDAYGPWRILSSERACERSPV